MNSCFARFSNSQSLQAPVLLNFFKFTTKKLEKTAVFTGDIKYSYCGEQLAEHRQRTLILSLICFSNVSALTLNVSFYL